MQPANALIHGFDGDSDLDRPGPGIDSEDLSCQIPERFPGHRREGGVWIDIGAHDDDHAMGWLHRRVRVPPPHPLDEPCGIRGVLELEEGVGHEGA